MLRSTNAGFGVRSIVVEATAIGAPMPALKDDLIEVVLRTQSPYAERLYALIALLRIGPEGEAAAGSAFHKLGTDVNALRLRAEMIHRMYGEPFGPADITTLLKDMVESSETVTGVLYTLAEHLPLDNIPKVLDGLPVKRASRTSRRNELEVSRFIDLLLIRAWRGIIDIEPARALQWLRLRNSYSSGYGGGLSDNLAAAIQERPDRLSAITHHFFETFVPDEDRWMRLGRFREVTLLQVTPEELLNHMSAQMARTTVGSDKELFLYEARARHGLLDGRSASELGI